MSDYNEDLKVTLEEDMPEPRDDCACDNCFYGRDRLAVELLGHKEKEQVLRKTLGMIVLNLTKNTTSNVLMELKKEGQKALAFESGEDGVRCKETKEKIDE